MGVSKQVNGYRMIRDFLMILFVTCTTISGQLLLKRAVSQVRDPPLSGVDWLIATFMSPLVWAAILVQGIGFIVWVVVISRMKLGMAFALAGASLYILMALVGWQLYGERLALVQWLGIMLISIGILLVSRLGAV